MKSMFWFSFVIFAVFSLSFAAVEHNKEKGDRGKIKCVICDTQKDE